MKLNEQQPYNPIIKYDRISDDITPIGKNAVMRFNVSLNMNIGNNLRFFHQEFEYNSKKSPDHSLVSVKRVYEYYISIENYNPPANTSKAFIKVTVKDFILLKSTLKACIAWHTEEKFAHLFVKDANNNVFVCPPTPDPIVLKLSQMGKYLKFEPAAIDNTKTGMTEPGILLTMSDPLNTVGISIDRLMAIYDILSNLNMFAVAQSMVPSITVPIGTCRTMMEEAKYLGNNSANTDKSFGNTSGIKGRKPTGAGSGLNDL